MEFHQRVRLDRYAIKDSTRDLLPQDLVVVSIERIFDKEARPVESREIGNVLQQRPDLTYDIVLDNDEREVVESVPRHRLEYVVEKTYPDICQRVATAVAGDDSVFEQQVYRLMVEEKFIAAGRILAGLGRPDFTLTLFNCYVFCIKNDSRAAIAAHWGRLFETFARGGGVGTPLSILRPKGAVVRKVNGRSSGSVSWAEQFSQITGAVEQGGSRRGASKLDQWCWHPDVEETIQVKAERETFRTPSGETVSRNKKLLEYANVSIMLTNDFMKAVEQDGPWNLVFPDLDDPDYDTAWDGDIWKWRDELGKPVVVYKTMKARDLWNQIIQRAWESGEPGLVFMEHCNDMSNSYYYAKLDGNNPCITGDTPVFTQSGILTVDELQGQQAQKQTDHFQATQDSRLTEATAQRAKQFFSTGSKPVFRLQTTEGYYLRCTANHRVLTSGGWKQADALEPGDHVHILNRGNTFGQAGSEDLGYVLGWLIADGSLSDTKAVMFFYDLKKELADCFAEKTLNLVDGLENRNRTYGITPTYVAKRDMFVFASVRMYRVCRELGMEPGDIKQVPSVIRQSTKETQRAFIRALFTADGTVNNNGNKGKGCSVRLDSTSTELLEGVQLLLLNFGVASKIYRNRCEAKFKLMPDGKGGQKEYWCQAVHTLALSKQNLIVFRDEIGFMLQYKQDNLESYLDSLVHGPHKEKFLARFESLTPDGEEEVFDTTVDQTHTYCSGGILSHNCSEQVLPRSGVCNLGHLNLSKFVLTDDQFPIDERTGTMAAKQVNWDGLTEAIQVGIRFLDQTSDLNQYHDKEVEKRQTSERRVGLGLLGYGEMLIRLGLRYGSEEALKFTTRLMKHFSTQSYLASVELAKTNGSFPEFDAEKFLKSGFMRRHAKEVKEAVEQHGIRNVTCTTIAPTGSTASLLRTTGGCEPYFSLQYTSATRIGIVEERQPIADELATRFGPEDTKWPSYVVTAQKGITPEQHVLTQGAMQRWIDAAISKTVGLPNSATVEDVAQTYMMMWHQGCKGGTVYRDGSRDEQVLYSETEPEPEVVVVEEKNNIGGLVPRPDVGLGVTFSEKSPLGMVHATIRHDATSGDARDVFILSSRGDVAADAEAIGRLISIILRWPNGSKISAQTRLEIVRDQLLDILGRNQIGIGPKASRSLPDTIAKIIDRYLAADFPMAGVPFGTDDFKQLLKDVQALGDDPEALAKLQDFLLYGKDTDQAVDQQEQHQESMGLALQQADQDGISLPCDLCPECGNGTLVTIPGKCPYCRTCGHTRC